ncbi:DEAD/DEAH box helicase family protein [Streptomyces phaeochromogenes]|uniref:DEAD/DEAH box helicase family protein n=1 Tax=Streptomyces phaeochromogenes TaxID=1923 RepID=UPI00316ADB28
MRGDERPRAEHDLPRVESGAASAAIDENSGGAAVGDDHSEHPQAQPPGTSSIRTSPMLLNTVRHLQVPLRRPPPLRGLRTQVVAATGSGKTLIAVESSRRLAARRELVLAPILDLPTQMTRAWRRGGRGGAMAGVCSLRAKESDGVPCNTDPDELAAWTAGSGEYGALSGSGLRQRPKPGSWTRAPSRDRPVLLSSVLPRQLFSASHQAGRSGILGRTRSAMSRRTLSSGRAPDLLHTTMSQ